MRRQTPESLFIIIHALQQGVKSVKVCTEDADVIAINWLQWLVHSVT